MIRRAREIVRGALSVLLFGVFGVGALLITPPMLLLRRPEWCQPIVRQAWRLTLFLFCTTRLIRIDRAGLCPMRGQVIAASHPSLIDVVILTALVPRTLYVAKRRLLSNPILSAIVRATALPDDAHLVEASARYLAAGWNVLIFPEGTRSPAEGGLQPLRRGAAQLALRTGAPLVGLRIDVDRRILSKRQRPWDMGDRRVTYALLAKELPAVRRTDESIHAAAVRLTEDLRRWLGGADACLPETKGRTREEIERIFG